ncbi:hypothetical protein RND81_12G190600 [Saponaria officinalis]|uniref:Bifunctional inhibitor/plant lipid transfer protein/seed storage helical domain-containing protein n=1 Tax=Saponaria officinalis TaxID=3572 RepID=A0AAW1HCS0_SAPOF
MNQSKTFMKMGSIMVVTILLLSLHIVPSSAQVNTCWTPIAACLEPAKAQLYPSALVMPCCPDITDAVDNELTCFCLGATDIISQQNGPTIFNAILLTCGIEETLDVLCP